jgi:hypothetical protein
MVHLALALIPLIDPAPWILLAKSLKVQPEQCLDTSAHQG